MLGGPAIAGILMTVLVSGKAGYRELVSRLLRWRVGAGWYAFALLAAPLVFAVVHVLLSAVSPMFIPGFFLTGEKLSFLMMGLAAALMVGVLEELGWTGFAIPRLKLRHGVFATGLIAGVLWAVWHLPFIRFWPGVPLAGELPLAPFLAVTSFFVLVGQLPAYRVLMLWVYDHTESLLLAMLMHLGLTASTFILGPAWIPASLLLVYDVALTAVWWIVVAAVAVWNGGRLSRRTASRDPLQPQVEKRMDRGDLPRQPTWQRIILLTVLGYEGAGAVLGGILLVAAPDGRLMDMPVEMMRGVFPDFLIPGLILTGLGILNVAAFVAVWRRSHVDWILAGLGLGGLAIWFIVEIAILQGLHWLHGMWGLPVVAGILVALPLIRAGWDSRYASGEKVGV
jgi:membrane protease YdiL (CAAX protease family)